MRAFYFDCLRCDGETWPSVRHANASTPFAG